MQHLSNKGLVLICYIDVRTYKYHHHHHQTQQQHHNNDTASYSSSDNNNDPIISVRWSPPFEGPLSCIENDKVNEYYMSYCAYQRMIDNSLSQIERLLQYISYTLENNSLNIPIIIHGNIN